MFFGANVPPKQVPSGEHFAELQSVPPEFSATQDDCDWFKEMQTTQSVFFSYPGMFVWMSQTLIHSAVEIGLYALCSWKANQ